MSVIKWKKVMLAMLLILLFITGCKKDEEKGEPEEEIVEVDTSKMSLFEGYNIYYEIDYDEYTIDWYREGSNIRTSDLKAQFPDDFQFEKYDLELETIYKDNLWFKVVRNQVIYSFIKANINGDYKVDHFNYLNWEPKIKNKRYVFDPVEQVVFFDNVMVHEGEENFGLFEKENVRSALFFSQLYSGEKIDSVPVVFSGTDINYKYSNEDGLTYLLANDNNLYEMTLEEIQEAEIHIYDYSQFEEFFDNNNQVLIESTLAKNHINVLNQNVMLALRTENYSQISKYVHESRGLRLVPFDRDAGEDAIFTIDYLAGYSNRVYEDFQYFGYINYIDTHMIMTLDQYYDYYIFPVDYSTITPSYNHFSDESTRFLLGNTSIKYYDRPIVVHYQYNGSNKGGNKDRSIKLVYEYIDNEWYLVMIMNNEGSV